MQQQPLSQSSGDLPQSHLEDHSRAVDRSDMAAEIYGLPLHGQSSRRRRFFAITACTEEAALQKHRIRLSHSLFHYGP